METITNKIQGWVKLHRQFRDKGYYHKSEYVHVWVECLLRANHKAKEIMWNGKTFTVQPGQFITGRRKFSLGTGISESRVHRILKYLENEQQIEQQTTNTSRLITILNWEKYQGYEQPNEQQVNSGRTASEQRVNTNKNDKNEENVKNEKNTTTCPEPLQAQDQSPVFIQIPLIKKDGEYGVTENQVNDWGELFPGVDVPQTLREIKAWSLANPTRRKTTKGIMSHIIKWLSREQNKS